MSRENLAGILVFNNVDWIDKLYLTCFPVRFVFFIKQ